MKLPSDETRRTRRVLEAFSQFLKVVVMETQTPAYVAIARDNPEVLARVLVCFSARLAKLERQSQSFGWFM